MGIYHSEYKTRYGEFGDFQAGKEGSSLVELPALTNLRAAWLFFENQEGYGDGDPMKSVKARVGPDLAGGVNAPTWDATEGAAEFDYTERQYFRAVMSAENGDFDFFTEASNQWAVHWVFKHDGGNTGLTYESVISGVFLTGHTGIRLLLVSALTGLLRFDHYPEQSAAESANGYTDMTNLLARGFTFHSDTAINAGAAQMLYIEDGSVGPSDTASHLSGTTPQSFDLFIGCGPDFNFPFWGHAHSLFIQEIYDDDASENQIVQDWLEAL